MKLPQNTAFCREIHLQLANVNPRISAGYHTGHWLSSNHGCTVSPKVNQPGSLHYLDTKNKNTVPRNNQSDPGPYKPLDIQEHNTLNILGYRCPWSNMHTRAFIRYYNTRKCESTNPRYRPTKPVGNRYTKESEDKDPYKYARIKPDPNSTENIGNYYDIRDPRNNVVSPGFHTADPRATVTSRELTTEQLCLEEMDSIVDLNTDDNDVIQLKKRCLVTGTWSTVEAPIDTLTPSDTIEAVLHNCPDYAHLRSVEAMYKHMEILEDAGITHSHNEILGQLVEHICTLANNKAFKVNQAILIAMIYDRHNMLTDELTYAIIKVIKEQLYALRSYDIAAAVMVYGKYKDRFSPMLNALGLVFYDLMVAGKTAVEPKGPNPNEMIAVVKAYGNANMPVKRVIDATYGVLYNHINEMTKTQLTVVLQSFFQLTKDSNYVEMYTKAIAALVGEPLIYVDNFQAYAEEQLGIDFNTPKNIYNVELLKQNDDITIPDTLKFMDAMARCNSELLINSVHTRIEFKRLWSDNIRKGIMPWKGPVISTQAESISTEQVPYASTFVDRPKEVNYKDQIIVLHKRMLEMLRNIVEPIIDPIWYLEVIYARSNVEPRESMLDKHSLYTTGIKNTNSKKYPMPIFKPDMLAAFSESDFANAAWEYIESIRLFTTAIPDSGHKKLSTQDFIKEVTDDISLGSCTNDQVVHLNEYDIPQCIAALNDYGRYDTGLLTETAWCLGALYFRTLFITPNSLDNIYPRSLVLQHPYLCFIESDDTQMIPEIHRIKQCDHRFYKPAPVYAHMLQGNPGLYGLAIYSIGNVIHRISTQDVHSVLCMLQQVNDAVQNIIHPFYVTRNLGNPLHQYSALYYTGNLVMCHKRDEIPESVINTIVIQTQNSIMEVLKSEPFKHVGAILNNAVISLFTYIITEREQESIELTIAEMSQMSFTVSMITAFYDMVTNQENGVRNHIELQQRILKLIGTEINNLSKDEIDWQHDQQISLVSRNMKHEETRTYADKIDTIAIKIEANDYNKLTEALGPAVIMVPLNSGTLELIHTTMQIMYKRVQYMGPRELIRAVISILDMQTALNMMQNVTEEDPQAQVVQLLEILKIICKQKISAQNIDTQDKERFSRHGRQTLNSVLE
ncbi:hypothetical protein BBOV_II006220 [Babesia bovis T2Bo]|uniref:Uncharacterized protein n=1 Tax=Babesia bovis TaxID=5865 RepID=A7AUG1_BABBO|nr:hypothetical protein BBOV_II006220 [Babesia bovis T2Bo]EDO06572.1 hypothetical protein BBOV_II006220 [Babesia bovis T2Bo]|eukprot:XP_001610140.1 hypothetical protein [Babesia bovis T2Bo]